MVGPFALDERDTARDVAVLADDMLFLVALVLDEGGELQMLLPSTRSNLHLLHG